MKISAAPFITAGYALAGCVAVCAAAVFATALLFTGCSGKTYYSIEIDALSYIPEDEHSRDWSAALDKEYYLYLLPYHEEFVEDTVSVEAEYSGGTEIEYPVPDFPEEGDLYLRFTIDVDVENTSSSGTLDAGFSLFIAEGGTEDVYKEEFEVSLPSGIANIELGSGESDTIEGEIQIGSGEEGFDALASGSAAIGVRGRFSAAAGAEAGDSVGAAYRINKLKVKISTRPFSFIP